MGRTQQQKIFMYTRPQLYLKKLAELDNAEARVTWLLKHNEHLRNCDKCLLFEYWKEADGMTTLEGFDYHDLTSAESITRCRRHIQNDLGLFLPTEEDIIEARGILNLTVKEWAIRKKEMEQ